MRSLPDFSGFFISICLLCPVVAGGATPHCSDNLHLSQGFFCTGYCTQSIKANRNRDFSFGTPLASDLGVLKDSRQFAVPPGTNADENGGFPLLKGRYEKIGRARLASHHPGKSLPMRLGGSLALPITTGFEFFHTCRGMACGGYGAGNPKDTPLRPP